MSSLSSLSSLSEMVSLKDMPNLVGGVGGCSLDEFDSKRSKDLAQRIFDFNAKVGGGSGNPVKPGDAARGNNIESVQARSSAITSMAISGGKSPENYEPAALMAPGAIRRTSSGSYQVGWSWEKTGGYPQKKWFSVGYKFAPLAAAYHAYPKWWLGIPSGCPYYQRYGYITTNGLVTNTPANANAAAAAPAPATAPAPAAANQNAQPVPQQRTPAAANATPQTPVVPGNGGGPGGLDGGAIGGTVTMKGGPFGFGTEGQETTVTGGGQPFVRKPTLELAKNQADQLKVEITHPDLVPIHQNLEEICNGLNRLFPIHSTTACGELLECMEKLYRCKVVDELGKHQVAYMKALINVCLRHIHKDCPPIATKIAAMLV
jgi:hypothetical protein